MIKPSFLIVGLGNPGSEYESSRHNVGWMALDRVADTCVELGLWLESKKFDMLYREATIAGHAGLLVKPLLYMNRSGEVAARLVNFYKLSADSQVIVLCDDVDLSLGEVRLRHSGGPGTHNGLKSMVQHLGEGFARVRIGIGKPPPGADLAEWVLQVLTAEERGILDRSFPAVLPLVLTCIAAA